MSITLAQLEQETARRLGPYGSFFTDRQIPNTANFTFVNFPELRSSIDLDGVTNLWLLRRGVDYLANPVVLDVDVETAEAWRAMGKVSLLTTEQANAEAAEAGHYGDVTGREDVGGTLPGPQADEDEERPTTRKGKK